MAGPAGSSLDRLIDVDVMKVLIAIAETRHCKSGRLLGKVLFVAHETEAVIIGIIAGIKSFRERLPQNPEIGGSMGVVAAGTVVVRYWPVKFRSFGQIGLHVGHSAGRFDILPVMAAQAEFGRSHDQQSGLVRKMRIVACQASGLGSEASVLNQTGGDFFVLIVVALEAEFFIPLAGKDIHVIRAVRIMAIDAGIGDGRMDDLVVVDLLSFVKMTFEADLISHGRQKLRKISRMDIVTGAATTIGHGTVHEFSVGDRIIMAEHAEIRSGGL